MTKHKRPIGIDLFAGAGGFSLGFEQAGFDVIGAVEIDPIHCSVHEYNFPKCSVICKDVARLSGEEIRDLLGLGATDIDVVFGGAPCQGFSMMGKRALEDPRNSLVNHFVRLVVELNPKYFVFENVYGLTVGEHQKFLEELINEFEDRGFNVIHSYRVLNASNYGVPQFRKRLFMIGGRATLPLPAYPKPITIPAGDKKLISELPVGPSVLDAIGDLPDVDQIPELSGSDSVAWKKGKASVYAKILRGEIKSEGDYSYNREFDRGLLTCSGSTDHSPIARKRFQKTKPGETEPVSHFLKLRPDGVCNTLRAGTASDRGAFTSARPIHPLYPRCITVREAARLHSYPDWFRFHSTKWHGFRQIGNSVPPLLGKAVASEIVKVLGFVPKKPSSILRLEDRSLLDLNMKNASDRLAVPSNVIAQRQRDVDGPRRKESPAYEPIIIHIFNAHFKSSLQEFEFERKEIETAAVELNIQLPANKGDVVYTFRYRKPLPEQIAEKAPPGQEWIIEGAGRSRYRFRLTKITRIAPSSNISPIKIKNETPELILSNFLSEEQALLANIRFNRIVDKFLEIKAYSLHSHLRTTVEKLGQIELDELYVGSNSKGHKYIVPVQAKGVSERISVVRARQDHLYCRQAFQELICRLLAAQFVSSNVIAIFELMIDNDVVRVIDEKHYHLA
jgi:DNA (cytosine-5)-methyltransferase 1